MFTLTEQWLFNNYGSVYGGQEETTDQWLRQYGKDVTEDQIKAWKRYKHCAEYQVNTPDIVPQALARVGTEFETELQAHKFINCLRVPGPSVSYLEALKTVSPCSILELGVGGDSAISTAIFLAEIENKENRKMVSVDRNPLGMTWLRYKNNSFWQFVQADSLEVLRDAISQGVKYDLVFIDTIHSYEHTLKEIKMASQITDNILLDDTLFPGNDFDTQPGGVKKALEEWVAENNTGWELTDYNGVGLLRKKVVQQEATDPYKMEAPTPTTLPKRERIAVAIAHGHATKWLQIVMHSLKSFKNEVPMDIYIGATWPNHPSLKAITENDLGDNVEIHTCTTRLHSHATALDEILLLIADRGYEYMFALETDCRVMQDGWLDWYYSFLKDNKTRGMAGFFWHEGKNHYNVNPSATLYLTEMLLKYNKEVKDNNENMFWHPRGNKSGNDGGMDPTIKDVVGCFAETRGIKNPTDIQLQEILEGVPQASWFEPGAWLYYRSLGEYGHVRLQCDHVYRKWGNHTAPEGTYYGGKTDCKLIHYWGGTRTYDWLKHPVNDNFVKSCSPLWIERENEIWMNTVPERYRLAVPAIYEEIGVDALYKKNMQ